MDMVEAFCISDFEKIFAFLAEAGAILIEIALVEVWKTSLKGLFSRLSQSLSMSLVLHE